VTKSSPTNAVTTKPTPIRRFFAKLGPGLITGAADDDPSGISTYSVAGAAIGYPILWTALFTFPLMAAVQLMCARLGMMTGRGLGGAIRKHYPRWVLWSACLLLIVANVFNIAADLGGMGASMHMVTGVPAWIWTMSFAFIITVLLIRSSYSSIVHVFKWLTLVLFAYVITAFLARPDWGAVLRATFIPHIEWSGSYMSMLVGILGTTISPYLFFWQASQEVEMERALGRVTVAQRRGATEEELAGASTDVRVGMFYSNLVMYFILLTTAATLHAHGMTKIETAQQAADALGPLAGKGAAWLFTIALVGTGILAVPVLAGSCAYAIAEAAVWRKASLNEKPGRAPQFYAVIAVAMFIGLVLNFAHVTAVRMLFYSAVLNGVLAPPLVVIVVLLSSSVTVMGSRKNSRLANALGWICAVAMAAAAVGMFVS
jgi:NRAMP (natural resistance-associated macrophage protein)-like metal ion transporter